MTALTIDTTTKTPVHSVVAVICDILLPLSVGERMRAMEAIAASLGISNPAARTPGERAAQPISGSPTVPLPQVTVNMTNGVPTAVPAPAVGLATPRSYRGPNGSSVSIGAPRGRAMLRTTQGNVGRVVVGGPHPSTSTPETSYRCR